MTWLFIWLMCLKMFNIHRCNPYAPAKENGSERLSRGRFFRIPIIGGAFRSYLLLKSKSMYYKELVNLVNLNDIIPLFRGNGFVIGKLSS